MSSESEQQSSTPEPDLRSPGRKRGRPERSPAGTGELRVQHIMRLMARYAYDPDVTPEELGAQWDLCPHTVRGYASEASRRVRSIVQDSDEVTDGALFALREIVRRCSGGKKKDFRTAVEAIRVMFGIVAAKKDRNGGGDGPPTFRIELVEPMKPGDQPGAAPSQPDEKTAGGPEGATGAA